MRIGDRIMYHLNQTPPHTHTYTHIIAPSPRKERLAYGKDSRKRKARGNQISNGWAGWRLAKYAEEIKRKLFFAKGGWLPAPNYFLKQFFSYKQLRTLSRDSSTPTNVRPTVQSKDPRHLSPLRHSIRVMRNHYLSNMLERTNKFLTIFDKKDFW